MKYHTLTHNQYLGVFLLIYIPKEFNNYLPKVLAEPIFSVRIDVGTGYAGGIQFFLFLKRQF